MIDHAAAGRLLEALADAWIAFDGDALVGLFTDDAVAQGDPADLPLVGHNALRAGLLSASEVEEQVEFSWERHWVVPPTILAPWQMRYIHRRSRARVSFAGFASFEIAEDGRIARARWWHFRHETPGRG